jgi:hypothetical protein
MPMEEEPMAIRGRGRRAVVAMLVAVLLVVTAVRPVAAAEDENHFAKDFGVGIGAVFTNIFYMPVKFVYATLGGITGGFAYVLTGLRLDLAKGIWVPSMGGTYVVTPSMLKGEDTIYFSGTTPQKSSSREEEDLPAKGDGGAGY